MIKLSDYVMNFIADQGVKDIFLLSNKANLILSERFLSSTQTQTQKNNADERKNKND